MKKALLNSIRGKDSDGKGLSIGLGDAPIVEHRLDALNHHVGADVVQTGVVTAQTGLVAVDAAWPARQIQLHDAVGGLAITHETSVWMGGSPQADHRCPGKRGKVHVSAVHGQHDIEMAHQHQFLPQSRKLRRGIDALRITLLPLGKDLKLAVAAAEKENAAVGPTLGELFDDLLHEGKRVYLAFMGGKRCQSDETPPGNQLADMGWQFFKIALASLEKALKRQFDGIAQLRQYIGIVLEHGGLLFEHLARRLDQLSLTMTVLVDMSNLVASHVEAETQVFRAQHVVEIGHGSEMLSGEPSEKGVKAFHSMVLCLQVGFHKPHVGSQVLEKRTRKLAAQHGDAQVRILLSER